MRFSAATLSATLAVAAGLASGFVPSASFARSLVKSIVASEQDVKSSVSHRHGCSCPHCAGACNCLACLSAKNHPSSCRCLSCGMSSALRMSEESTTDKPSEEVPPEVAALDGVASEEEAHNVERPARGSGLHKHTKGKSDRTPLSDLEVGSMVEGKVKTITNYGAFLDVGAQTDALLHVSCLSDEFVSNVEDIIKVGETVQVRIVGVDQDKSQVAVSMRSAEGDEKAAQARAGGKRRQRPQRSAGDRQAQVQALTKLAGSGYDSDKFVEGEVVSTLDFGAFVRFDTSQLGEDLEGEIDGLVHISALTPGRADSVEAFVSVGDKVQIRVKGVDAEGGKVSLSMISKEDEPEPRKRGGGGNRGAGRMERWMGDAGPADWKEQLEKFQTAQPDFKNSAVIVDKRK